MGRGFTRERFKGVRFEQSGSARVSSSFFFIVLCFSLLYKYVYVSTFVILEFP